MNVTSLSLAGTQTAQAQTGQARTVGSAKSTGSKADNAAATGTPSDVTASARFTADNSGTPQTTSGAQQSGEASGYLASGVGANLDVTT